MKKSSTFNNRARMRYLQANEDTLFTAGTRIWGKEMGKKSLRRWLPHKCHHAELTWLWLGCSGHWQCASFSLREPSHGLERSCAFRAKLREAARGAVLCRAPTLVGALMVPPGASCIQQC